MNARKRVLLLLSPVTHRALKVEAARADIEMSDLADIAVSHVAGLLASGHAPAAVLAAIEKAHHKDDEGPKPSRKK